MFLDEKYATEEKDFDCVKMTRMIRDELYEKYKDLDVQTYLKTIKKEVRESDLWKEKN